MQLTWVNHASFLLDTGKIRLVCDPWIEGTVFNDGWRLMSQTKMKYEDFRDVTHIWFSHEHPDHFFPPNLKRIPEDARRKITVLFHETRDKRVVNVCRSMGFAVQELPDTKRAKVTDDCEVICGRRDLLDSWLGIFVGGKTILNLNDCVLSSREELLPIVEFAGKPDLMLSQFSYANWVGNPGDTASHNAHAMRKRIEMSKQIRTIQPRQFIPFASFVYFCHDENFFMNHSVNRISDVFRLLEDELGQTSLVLYPGETWEIGSHRNSRRAIERYEVDFQNALHEKPLQSRSVEIERLQEAMADLIAKCCARNSALLLKAMPPSVVRLRDMGQDFEVSYRHGMRPVHGQPPDIILSSDSLLYCINTDWGGETLKINGRFEIPSGGNVSRFFRLFRVPQYNSYGSNVNLRFVAGRLIDALRRHASN